jgi:hypothetical protein
MVLTSLSLGNGSDRPEAMKSTNKNSIEIQSLNSLKGDW